MTGVQTCALPIYSSFFCRRGIKYQERRALEQIIKDLPSGRFVQIDRGVVVNMKFIVEQKRDTVIVRESSEEIKLKMSRGKEQEAKEKLMKYWVKK